MIDHPNVAIVRRMYERFGAGDFATIRDELFTNDVLWHLPGHHPLSGTKRGPEEVLAFFRVLLDTGIKVEMMTFTGTDTYVVDVHRSYTDAGSTIALNCAVHQIRGSRIAEVQMFVADQHAVDAFFWSRVDLEPIPDRLAGVRGAEKRP
jgi:ketosteroid isomerase-like protein